VKDDEEKNDEEDVRLDAVGRFYSFNGQPNTGSTGQTRWSSTNCEGYGG